MLIYHSDPASVTRPAPIPEQAEQTEQADAKPAASAREQKITPFDVEGEVDASGKNIGM
jgi:tryptophanyl-tRNA synthetase